MASDLPFQHKPAPKPNYKERVRLGLQRGGLKQQSDKKKQWGQQYVAKIKEDDESQECHFEGCNKVLHKDAMSRHHPKGQIGENILYYIYYCIEHHTWIHKHPNEARELGYLEM